MCHITKELASTTDEIADALFHFPCQGSKLLFGRGALIKNVFHKHAGGHTRRDADLFERDGQTGFPLRMQEHRRQCAQWSG